MAGKLGRNLRQGHNAESRGIDLLVRFCAVARIPQEEDVGADAIATLLRNEAGSLYAEESFWIQFKACSVREITYANHEYRWLRDLMMPLFIGSVDADANQVALFTTGSLASRVDGEAFKSAIAYLDPRDSTFENDVVHQSLGPPILRWTAEQGEDPEFKSLAYRVLKEWMNLEYVNLRLRALRTSRIVHWKTNEVPVPGLTTMMGHPSELDEDLAAALPYLNKLAMHFLALDAEASSEALGLYLLALGMQERGIAGSSSLVKMMSVMIGSRFKKLDLRLTIEKE